MVEKNDRVSWSPMSPSTGSTHPTANFNLRMEEDNRKENKMVTETADTRTGRAYKDKFGFIRMVLEVAADDGTVADLVKKITTTKITYGKYKGQRYYTNSAGVRAKLKKYRQAVADSETGGALPALKDERAGGKRGPEEMARYLAQLQEG